MNYLRFHKIEDEQQLRFYQMPKLLFTNQRYHGLSLGAKAMYSILRDRQELSIKNKWLDNNDCIYLIFTVEKLSELLDVSIKTTIKYKKELTKYQLLFEKRLGQGKPNRLYILKPEYSASDIYTSKTKFKSAKKNLSVTQSIENTKTSNNYNSRVEKNTFLDMHKVQCNDTDLNDTNVSDNHSIIHKDLDTIKESNLNTTNLEYILEKAEVEEIYFKNNYYPVKRAIESLYYRNKDLNINNISIPPSKIKTDLLQLNYFHIEMGLQIFKEQSKKQQIKNRISYLATCIYTSIFDIELKVQNDLIYNRVI